MPDKAMPDPTTFRHLVNISKATGETRDTYNQVTPTYTDKGKTYASILPLSGREQWLAQQAMANVTHRVTIRHPGFALTAKDRFLFADPFLATTRTFEISSVINVEERNLVLECMCMEKV